MTGVVNRKFVLAARPVGSPREQDFRLEEETLPGPAEGELLLATLYLSLDPYMRFRMNAEKSYSPPTEIGQAMEGWGIAQVLESRHPDYAQGDIVLAPTRWQTRVISAGLGLRKLDPEQAPVTTALGVLGMPGFTAYAGLLNIGRPRPGETVVVAAATGPVGSAVGQIARIKGARTVGIAGGTEKCRALTEEFRFDVALDHRDPNFADRLAAACPSGIDVYFENVGGHVLKAVLPLMNEFGRIPLCGLVAQYNEIGVSPAADELPAFLKQILVKSLTVRGFIQREFAGQYGEFLREMGAWVREGRVHYRQDVVDGFENAPAAFIGLLSGRNFGKLLVKV